MHRDSKAKLSYFFKPKLAAKFPIESPRSSATVNTCYCEGEFCNDIPKCLCTKDDDYTPYANLAKNTEWANAENSAPRDVIATAFATVLSAVGAFWLL